MWLERSISYHPDGLDYAAMVASGSDLFHPHHLFYSPIAWLIYKLLPVSAIDACQAEQILFAALMFFGAWKLATRILGSPGLALAAALLLMFSRGVLLYSTWLEVYVPALAATVLLLNELTSEKQSTFRIAAYLSLAILLHQTNVLLVIPLLLYVPDKRRSIVTVAVSGLVVIAAYVMASWGTNPIQFIFKYPMSDVPVWGGIHNISLTGLTQLGANLWRSIAPLPGSLEPILGWVSIFGLTAGLIIWLRRSLKKNFLINFSTVWLLVYLLFILWWLPGDQDFGVAALAPMWIIFVVWWKNHRRLLPVKVLAAGILLLAVVNIATTVVPNHRHRSAAYYEAETIHQSTPADSTIVTTFEVQQNLQFFFDREDVFLVDE